MEEEVNSINIPAYQRKRSISAKARKKPSYLKTNPKRKTRKRTTEQKVNEIPILSGTIEEPEIKPITREVNIEEIREMKICGKCDGYFDNIEVAIIKISSPLREGDRILLETETGMFEQAVTSMQINRKNVKLARTGSDIGIKTAFPPKVGGQVYKVI